MADFLTKSERSERMRQNRAKNTKLEVGVRDFLEEQGYELELHSPEIISHPDIVIRSRNAIVLVHGCFWHRHKDCRIAYAVTKATPEKKRWWAAKFARQVARDNYVLNELLNAGWRVVIVWECAVSEHKAPKAVREESLQEIIDWLESEEVFAEIRRPVEAT